MLLSGSGSPPVSTLTGASDGAYSLTGFGFGAYTITPTKVGGANTAISSYDAALVAQHVVGPPAPTLQGNQLIVADVSGSGDLSSFDAAEIAIYSVGGTRFGTSGTWRFDPVSNFHSSVTSSIIGENYSALLFGDVSGNWNFPDSLPGRQQTRNSGPERKATVSAPQTVALPGSQIVIPVTANGIADKGIISYEFTLSYDPSVIKPDENPVGLARTVSRGLTAVTNIPQPGILRVAVYGAFPIESNGILLNLRFIAVGAPGSATALTFDKMMFNEGEPKISVTSGSVKLSTAAFD